MASSSQHGGRSGRSRSGRTTRGRGVSFENFSIADQQDNVEFDNTTHTIGTYDSSQLHDFHTPPPATHGNTPDDSSSPSIPHIDLEEEDAELGGPSPSTSSSRTRKTTSIVWNFFTKTSCGGFVVCNICAQKYKYTKGDQSTSTLTRHIRKFHHTSNDDNMTQSTLNPQNMSTFTPSYALTRSEMARYIAADALPFTHSSSPHLTRFCQKSQNPNFRPVPRTTLTSDVKKAFKEMKKTLIQSLTSLRSKVSLTADMWESQNELKILCVTCHWIDCEWLMQKRIICFTVVQERATHTNLEDLIMSCAREYGICDKVISCTFDNGSNMVASIPRLVNFFTNDFAQLGDIFHIRCCCHNINLVVNEGIAKIGGPIYKIKEACKFIRQSKNVARTYRKRCDEFGLKYKKLRLVCKTRWNSTYLMLERAFEYKSIITSVNNEHLQDNHISPSEWNICQKFVNFLEPFCTSTTLLSGVYYPTSHLVLGEMVELATHLKEHETDPDLCDVVPDMKEKFLKYYEPFPYVFAMCSVLDPRHKLKVTQKLITEYHAICGLTDHRAEPINYMDHVKFLLKEMYRSYVERFSRSARPPRPPSFVRAAGTRRSRVGELLEQWSTTEFTMDDNQLDELEYYLGKGLVPLRENIDIISWWRDNTQFPTLSFMARDLLTIPASSVPSESAFSEAKRQLDERRSSMVGSTLETLVCLKDWIAADSRTQNVESGLNSEDEGFLSHSSTESEVYIDDDDHDF